jgi:phosphatidylserine decarboxylase
MMTGYRCIQTENAYLTLINGVVFMVCIAPKNCKGLSVAYASQLGNTKPISRFALSVLSCAWAAFLSDAFRVDNPYYACLSPGAGKIPLLP